MDTGHKIEEEAEIKIVEEDLVGLEETEGIGIEVDP